MQDWGLSLHVWSTPVPGPRWLCPSLGVGVDFLRSVTHGCTLGSLDKEVKLRLSQLYVLPFPLSGRSRVAFETLPAVCCCRRHVSGQKWGGGEACARGGWPEAHECSPDHTHNPHVSFTLVMSTRAEQRRQSLPLSCSKGSRILNKKPLFLRS